MMSFKNNYVEIKEDKNAIFYIKFSPIDPTESEFDEYLAFMTDILDKEKYFLRVFDASEAKYLSASLRIKQGKWIKQYQEKIKKYSKGSVFIIPSLLIRIIFQGITMIAPLPDENTIVKNLNEANAWIEKQLKKYE